MLVVKNPSTKAGDIRDVGSIPGWGRYPGEGNGSPLQYSCFENPMDRGAWWATIHGVKESDTTEAAEHKDTTQAYFQERIVGLVAIVNVFAKPTILFFVFFETASSIILVSSHVYAK